MFFPLIISSSELILISNQFGWTNQVVLTELFTNVKLQVYNFTYPSLRPSGRNLHGEYLEIVPRDQYLVHREVAASYTAHLKATEVKQGSHQVSNVNLVSTRYHLDTNFRLK